MQNGQRAAPNNTSQAPRATGALSGKGIARPVGRQPMEAGASSQWHPDQLRTHSSVDSSADVEEAQDRTTVMLRNLPNQYTRTMLLNLIDSGGFAALYDFVNLPVDFKSGSSLGYAFVNFVNTEVAKRFQQKFDGFSDWIIPSRKVCGVTWSGPHQGLQAHIERYRNSPVMHESVSDTYKPIIFKDGQRIPFPPPTRKLRAPRVRAYRPGQGGPDGNRDGYDTSD